MEFKIIKDLESAGLIGFRKVSELRNDITGITGHPGVYMVLYTKSDPPVFLKRGTGGRHKNKDPNVSIEILQENWIENTIVIYIGQTSKQSLRERIDQYLQFGQGKSKGHYGGRFIWQIKDSDDLVICWTALPDDNPKKIESQLISLFHDQYGKLPFANLQG